MPTSYQPSGPFTVANGADRHGGQHRIEQGTCIVRYRRATRMEASPFSNISGGPRGGAPFHVQPEQDEIVVVQEGRYLFLC
jgi:hypothetical protein